MRTPHQQVNREPFALTSGVIFFHDWRWVNHGYPGWRGPGEQPVPVFGTEPLPAIHYVPGDTPFGLRLCAVPACKGEPFLAPEMPWEGMIGAPAVVQEGGRYRLWYEAVPREESGGGVCNWLCHAESADGLTWQRSSLREQPVDGRPSSIVYGGALAGPWGYHGGAVFVDPAAPAAERYKVLYLMHVTRAEAEAFQAANPERAAAWPPVAERVCAVAGAVSADGLHWTRLPEPLVLHLSDTHNTVAWDAVRQRYVWFCRTWVMGRRAVGRAETADFRRWPLPETILWPGADVGATDTWYGNGKTTYPGAPDYHLLFPWRWRIGEDRFFTHLLTGPDGVLWGAPPANEVLAPGPRGAWDAGGTISGCGMVELPGDRIGIPYVGYRVPHKYPRRPPLGAFAWATWERDRLVALEADERGEFSTWVVTCPGTELRVNAITRHTGLVQVAVLGPDRVPLPGFGLDDCDPLEGDLRGRTVTWRGNARLADAPGQPRAFQLRLRQARLFSLRFT